MTKEQFREYVQHVAGNSNYTIQNYQLLAEIVRKHDPALAAMYDESIETNKRIVAYCQARSEKR